MREAGMPQSEYIYTVELQLCRYDSEPTWITVERKCNTCIAADAKAERLKEEKERWDRVKARVSEVSRTSWGKREFLKLSIEAREEGGFGKRGLRRKMAISGPSAGEPSQQRVKAMQEWIDLTATSMLIDRDAANSNLDESVVHGTLAEAMMYLKDHPELDIWLPHG
jgi:hypothetical protein